MATYLPKPHEMVTVAGICALLLGGVFTAVAFIVLFVSLAGNGIAVDRALIMLGVAVGTSVIGGVTASLGSKAGDP